MIRVDLQISSDSGRLLILKWTPVIAMPPRSPERDSHGEAKAGIWYRATKKDGKVIDVNI